MHKFFLTTFCVSAGLMAMEENPVESNKAQNEFAKSWQALLEEEQNLKADYVKKQRDLFTQMMHSQNKEGVHEKDLTKPMVQWAMSMIKMGRELEVDVMQLSEGCAQKIKTLAEDTRKALEPFQEQKQKLLKSTDDHTIIDCAKNLSPKDVIYIIENKKLETELISEFFIQQYNEFPKMPDTYDISSSEFKILIMILSTQQLSEIAQYHLSNDIIKHDYLLNSELAIVFFQSLAEDQKIHFLKKIRDFRSTSFISFFLRNVAKDPRTNRMQMSIVLEISRQNKTGCNVIDDYALWHITEKKFEEKLFVSNEEILNLYDQGDEVMKQTVFQWAYISNHHEARENVRLEIIRRYNRKAVSWKDIINIRFSGRIINNALEALKYGHYYGLNMLSYNKKLAEITSQIPQQFHEPFLQEINELRLAPGVIPDESAMRMGEYIPCKTQTIDYPMKNAKDVISHDWVTLMKQKRDYEKWKEGKVDYNTSAFDCFIDRQGNPLGYHAFIPQESCNKAIVIVYGGYQRSGLDKAYNNIQTRETQLWNAQGYTFIKLNGLDLWKNATCQSKMDWKLHNNLLSGYADFIDALKKGDVTDLEFLKNCDVFLQGHSFGGATVVRFAQEYPNLINGVISINGALNIEGKTYRDYLYPYGEQKKLKVPALLMATAIDNCLSMQQSVLSFQEQTTYLDSKNVSIYVHPNGKLNADNPVYIGHHLPTEEAFGVMFGFTQGRNNNFFLNNYRLAKAEILSALTKDNPTLWEEALLELHKTDCTKNLSEEELEKQLRKIYLSTCFRREKTALSFGYNPISSQKDYKILNILKPLTTLALNNLEEPKKHFVEIFKNHYAEIGFEKTISENVAKKRINEIDWKKALDLDISMTKNKPFTLEEAMICEVFGRFAAEQALSENGKQWFEEFTTYTNRFTNLKEKRLEIFGHLAKDLLKKKGPQTITEEASQSS